MIGFHFINPTSGNIWSVIAQPSERADAYLVGNKNDSSLKAIGYTDGFPFRFIPGTYRDLCTRGFGNTNTDALIVEGQLCLSDILP